MNDYLTLQQARKQCPGRVSAPTVWRWCRRGLAARSGQRVRLRHVRIGGKLYTKEQWLVEFFEALAQADGEYFEAQQHRPRPQPKPRANWAQREHEKAKAYLASKGVRSN